MERPLSKIERTEAQRRIEVDEALLRGVRSESVRLRSRIRMLEGEMAGAQQAISEKERQIRETADRVAELQQRLERLQEHEVELQNDQASWNGRIAG